MNSQIVVALFLALVHHVLFAKSTNQSINSKVHYLEPGDTIQFAPDSIRPGFFANNLQIYCYRGDTRSLSRIFETIELQLNIKNDDFMQYKGETPEMVETHYEEQKSIFNINLFAQKKTRLSLPPLRQQCIGVETIQPYTVHLHLIRIDFWKVIQMAIGIFMFSFAAKLSKNSIFYYSIGIMIGVCSSFMLLVYLLGKLFPKRPIAYGVLIGGWTIGVYVIQMLWENFRLIIVTYRMYVFWYIVITGFISFVICYRLGPPKNKRSKDLIKWSLQLLSLVTIYFSSQFEEAAASVVILTFLKQYFPQSWLRKLRLFYLKRFPPKKRLLTSEEYYEQGVRETTKALEELRNYCNSPECKQWRIMKKLKQPIRFAEFVEGSSHIQDEEILSYETEQYKYEHTDDDTDESDDSEPVHMVREDENEISEDDEEETDVEVSCRRTQLETSGRYDPTRFNMNGRI